MKAGRLIVTALILNLIAAMAGSAAPYRSYTYSYWEKAVPSPVPYVPTSAISGRDLGVGDFNKPSDIFVDNDSLIYVADTGNNRIVVFDLALKSAYVLSTFHNHDAQDRLKGPQGVFVRGEFVYVADTGNSRVLVFDRGQNLVQEIHSPSQDSRELSLTGFRFIPGKIAANTDTGSIYVVNVDSYDGILEFTRDGQFRGFLGAPRVTLSLADYIWWRLANDEQKRRMQLFLPTEYTSLDLDSRGFIYAVASGDTRPEDVIRRLNPSGKDTLRRFGFSYPIGDYGCMRDEEGEWILPPSTFVDIIVRENGIYSALDRRRGRVFTYDANGNLLYVFGGIGQQLGLFQAPVAMDEVDNHIMVLDSQLGTITVFEPTDYQFYIHQAIASYETGDFEQSILMWQEVLKRNSNYDLAYSGIGTALMVQNRFREALVFFKLGNDRQGYSRAFYLYRREVLTDHFSTIMLVLFGCIGALSLARYWKKQKVRPDDNEGADHSRLRCVVRALKYSLYVMTHPAAGFWDMKYENEHGEKANAASSAIILLLTCLALVLKRQYTGFIMNTADPADLNVLLEVLSVLVPFGIWCVANWILTTLIDGKGKPIHIFNYSAVALVPYIIIQLLMIPYSSFITVEEAAFYHILDAVSIGWSGLLILMGTMVTHEFTLTKTIVSGLFIFAGMLVISLLGLVAVDLFDQVLLFFRSIYTEVIFR